jgi:sugar lactone lactonase YvrE
MTTVASGLGILESLLPDNHGRMLLSSSSNNAVERLTRTGKVTTIASASSPGQLVWHRKRVFVPTGDDAGSGLQNKSDGTLKLLNLKTGRLAPYAKGLTMPNGLAVAHNGNAFATRDIGSGTGVTRIAAAGHHKVTSNWSPLSDTNGIAINRKHKVMYVDRTFTASAPVVRIPLRHPKRTKQIGDLSTLGSAVPKGLDDLIMGSHGVLYLPGNSSGEVFSFDPANRKACVIASGLQNPSAVAVGTGHGWQKGSLFVCGFDGTVRRLDPPKR